MVQLRSTNTIPFKKKCRWLPAVLALLGASAAQVVAQEPTFATSNSIFAVVEATGALARANGATGSTRLGVGKYQVSFSQSTAKCALQASTGYTGSSGSPTPRQITIRRTGNKRNLLVSVYTSAGVPTDTAFHLIANCSKAG